MSDTPMNDSGVEDEDCIWDVGVFDAHCHPTDIMASIPEIRKMGSKALCIMATRSQDQDLVAEAAASYPLHARPNFDQALSRYVIPAFGWHPWFSYQIIDDRLSKVEPDATAHYKSVLTPPPEDEEYLKSLPGPKLLTEFLTETEAKLLGHPFALVGEIGLDRSFRLPVAPFHPPGQTDKTNVTRDGNYTPGSREGRPLSPYRVSMDHQKMLLKAQLELAAKFSRPVSIHSVQTHGVVFELLQNLWSGHQKASKRQRKREKESAPPPDEERTATNDAQTSVDSGLKYPPRICLHSYSGPAGPLRQFLNPSVPAEVFFSFSTVINFSTPSVARVTEVIAAVPDDRILVESDFHCAGTRMDELLLDIVVRVCRIKGWGLREGAARLKQNWGRFVFG